MAILPLKSRPRMTSLAVVEAPKPEPMGVCWVNRRNLLENVLRQGSNALDSSSSPARSSPTEFCQLNGVIIPIGTLAAPSPDEWCRPNAALDVSRPVGTRGGVGWMRGPCACPGEWRFRQGFLLTRWIISPGRGQAQGPHPSPHPPLVPTERRGRTRPDGRDYPLRLATFIRTEADVPNHSPIRLSKIIR